MLGFNGAVAAGLHRQHGWKITAMAGVAAVSPDWDGLMIVVSRSAFAEGHRLWGHNVLACIVVGLIIGVLDYRLDLVTRCAGVLRKVIRFRDEDVHLSLRSDFTSHGLWTWMLVAMVAALSQLPVDMVISGTATLPAWELQPFWPFSDKTWIFPLVPWGDVGITVIFIAGMFAMARWRRRLQWISCVTLAAVFCYIAVRGAFAT
jgi:hypothetical protein